MIRGRSYLYCIYLGACLMLAACAAVPERADREAVHPLVVVESSEVPFPADDLDTESLRRAIEQSLTYYDRVPATTVFSFGRDCYTLSDMKASLLEFLEIVAASRSDDERNKRIGDAFRVYKSVGRGVPGRVLFTGYYEPLLHGSLEKTDRYRYPLYRIPDDHVTIDLGQFRDRYRGESVIARIDRGRIVPYYTRRDIDVDDRLKGRGLELAWVDDPVDLFFLHIQGSGMVELPDGTVMKVSYAHKNGHPYRSIGRLLVDRGKMSLEGSSLQSIKRYLRDHPQEMADILAHNESYVFFRRVEEGPIGCLDVPVTSGRSIATDSSLYPRGALAFIRTKKPLMAADGSITGWVPLSRFVLNQDTGGAIKGPGRVDLFCGNGRYAEVWAGNLKEEGELYFLVRKR